LEDRGFVLSALVVGIVVVCGLILVVSARDDTPAMPQPAASPSDTPTQSVSTQPTAQPTATPAQPTATPDPTVGNSPAPGTGCRASNVAQTWPSTPPLDVTWIFQSGMLMPTHPQLGPTIEDADGVRRCFQRSPAGAVVAAMVTLVQAQAQDKDLYRAVLGRRFAPGAGRTAALGVQRTPVATDPAAPAIQFAGFKIVDYTPSRAIVSVAVQAAVDEIAALQVTVSWVDGDWKIVLTPDGRLTPTDAMVLVSLYGYIPFRGA
jgi:hypothetical protein